MAQVIDLTSRRERTVQPNQRPKLDGADLLYHRLSWVVQETAREQTLDSLEVHAAMRGLVWEVIAATAKPGLFHAALSDFARATLDLARQHIDANGAYYGGADGATSS